MVFFEDRESAIGRAINSIAPRTLYCGLIAAMQQLLSTSPATRSGAPFIADA